MAHRNRNNNRNRHNNNQTSTEGWMDNGQSNSSNRGQNSGFNGRSGQSRQPDQILNEERNMVHFNDGNGVAVLDDGFIECDDFPVREYTMPFKIGMLPEFSPF